MAVRMVTGNLGSGKTYYVVKHILDNYGKWDDVQDKWVLKDGIEIYSNIRGMHLGKDLLEVIKEAGGLNPFFTAEYQRDFARNQRIIYIIDECQGPKFFHRKYYDIHVFECFTLSRQLGLDIYLICQDADDVCREIRSKPEYMIEASPRVRAFWSELRYRFLSSGQCFKTKILKKEPKVFSCFQSMLAEETEKISSAPRRFIYMFGGLAVLILVLFFGIFLPVFAGGNNKIVNKPVSLVTGKILDEPAKPVPVSLPEKTTLQDLTKSTSYRTTSSGSPRVENQNSELKTLEIVFYAGFFGDHFLLNDSIYTAVTAQAVYHRVFAVDVRTGFLTVDGVSYSVGSSIKL